MAARGGGLFIATMLYDVSRQLCQSQESVHEDGGRILMSSLWPAELLAIEI